MMSKGKIVIELPKNMITTLQEISNVKGWSIDYLIEDAVMIAYKEEITNNAIEMYLGLDDD